MVYLVKYEYGCFIRFPLAKTAFFIWVSFLYIADDFILITYTVTAICLGFLIGCVRGDQLDSSHSAWHLFTWGDLMLLMFRKKTMSAQVMP